VIRFHVTITASAHGGDMPGFLDMLRYEQGRVITWNHDADGRWTVEIEVEDRLYQPDRWSSFGIYPRAEAANSHPGVRLLGGDVPAHRPGAYPRLSCCGGDKVLTDLDLITDER